MKLSEIPENVERLAAECERGLAGRFEEIDAVARENTRRVLEAFQEQRVSEPCFAGTTGYGYDDLGRETLDKVWARVFGAESALVRVNFVNGTHAIASALFAALKPGDTLLSVMGAPYDTLRTAIGISGSAHGSLREYGVGYAQVETLSGGPDLEAIARAAREIRPAAALVQRSRGYDSRRALTVPEIGEIIRVIKSASPETAVVVDNCYGEFLETSEPKADLLVGSFIKNPGGGLADTGGYIAGSAACVELAACRLTSPGIGGEMGATLDQTKKMLRGLFYAPHTVLQALKTAAFAAYVLERLGFEVSPGPFARRLDLVQSIHFRSERKLVAFCRGIQAGSPVDAFAVPEPWDMPGYQHKVIMAAGTFTQGASIELSADAPIREPYTLYLQGGLTFESGVWGVLHGVEQLLAETGC